MSRKPPTRTSVCMWCLKEGLAGHECPTRALVAEHDEEVNAETPSVRDSDTSEKAAREIEAHAETCLARVLAYIVERGEGGATDDEMQVALDMNPSTQRPRRIDLCHRGIVVDSGLTRRTRTGRDAVVWIDKRQRPLRRRSIL